MAQEIITLTSESLEKAYRDLTPSQNGFTQDLMASNTIIPVLDLSSAAGGSSALGPEYITALSIGGDRFESGTSAAAQAVSSLTGFVRVYGTLQYMLSDSAGNYFAELYLDDGASEFVLVKSQMLTGVSVQSFDSISFDFVYFAASGVSLKYNGGSFNKISLTASQIATDVGVLVYPSGYTPQ